MTLDRLDVGFAAGVAIILMLGGAALALPDTDCHNTREQERGTGAQCPGRAAGPPQAVLSRVVAGNSVARTTLTSSPP